MKNIREWLSDNLRYILLGLAIILILGVAVFAVKLINGLSDSSTTKETESNTPQSVIVETTSESEELENNLVKDDPSVLEIVERYYTAWGNKDVETLGQIVEAFDQTDLDNENIEVESYQNISVYTKTGMETGSYVTYIYYDAKVVDIESLVPSLSCMYLKTKEDGSLYFADLNSDQAIKDYIAERESDSDVKSLIASVTEKYLEVEASDPSLKALIDSKGNRETESVLPDSGEAGVQTNKIVEATDVCNVRADSREDSEVIGMLDIGTTVTRVQKLDNGWSEIKYDEGTGYVKSEYLEESTSQ